MRSKAIKTSEIRELFVEYFKDRDHQQVASSPVIPFDDPTILFANAGMNQFKDIFTGQKKSEYPRAVSVQKCMRAGGKHNDLENVGRTGRHHTFFEMLGNFSFGDYFKEEAIFYAWEFVTKNLALPIDKLYATVYLDDNEAFDLWGKIAPELKNGRIMRFDKKENYWSMGNIGPCGPCSEIHFDRGEKFGTGPEAVVNGESERFVEIWNLVFMQFNQNPDGTIVPLPKPSVDTGAGLERLTCVKDDAYSNYETDIFKDLISTICDITGQKYHLDETGVSHRVIADHIRALTFCIADGGGLSNEKQGYVLRRILRRAARHGRKLNMQEPFIYKLVPTLVNLMGDVYPEIKEKQRHIENVIKAEEESFGRTLDTGLELFEDVIGRLKKSGEKIIPGEDVFKLCDTYGFPPDLTAVMAEERGFQIDMFGFERLMVKQQKKSRAVQSHSQIVEQHAEFIDSLKEKGFDFSKKTIFFRNGLSTRANVLSASMSPFPHVAIVLNKTPFYVESGGQISDIGKMTSLGDEIEINIDEVYRHQDVIIHAGEVVKGDADLFQNSFAAGREVNVEVNEEYRTAVMRNHTATHLLHAALRKVLGEHVRQSGSYVGPDKLRFDFSHFQPMTSEEKFEVEQLVNAQILKGASVSTVEDDLENAKKSGAMAIFGEKYGSKVRVVSIDDFSKELCGGTHVENVSQIGPFMITLETGIATGVRRIEAVTGTEAVTRMLEQKNTVTEIGTIINRPANEMANAVKELNKSILDLQKENKKLKADKFSTGATEVGREIDLGKLKFVPHNFGEVETDEMAGWVDRVKIIDTPLVTAATGIINGKATLMAAANKASGVHVGKLLKLVISELGGRGGGKENFAQGTFPSDLDPEKLFAKLESKLRES